MAEDIIDSGKRESNGEIIWRDTVSGDEWVDGATQDIWPTQEQFDAATEQGSEQAREEIRNGATEPREAPLSGEWADGIDWQKVCRNVGYTPDGENYPGGEDASELADAWERGYFDTWAHEEDLAYDARLGDGDLA